jgi:hypothetical protein
MVMMIPTHIDNGDDNTCDVLVDHIAPEEAGGAKDGGHDARDA